VFFYYKKFRKTTKIFLVFPSVHGQHLRPRFIYLFIYLYSSPWFCDVENFGQKYDKIRKFSQIYTLKKQKIPHIFLGLKTTKYLPKAKALLTPGPHGVREFVALLSLLVQNSCIIIIIIIIIITY
jgi:hypothetical protein